MVLLITEKIYVNMSDSEDEWRPPSEAEMKVIQAKRERSDKISKVMGDYLLKGYKMLATSCPLCLTVQLQDKQGAKFCVACQEVDCHETSKDDPAINQQAASRIIQEEAFSSSGLDPDPPPASSNLNIARDPPPVSSNLSIAPDPPLVSSNLRIAPDPPPVSSITRTAQSPAQTPLHSSSRGPRLSFPPEETSSSSLGARPKLTSLTSPHSESSLLSQTRTCLLAKLDWANTELESCSSPDRATQLVILVREIVQTIVILNQCQPSN